jgi:hypothetical protein
MGKLIWEGWQTSVSDAPQPIGIIMGKNLRASSSEASPKDTEPKKQPDKKQHKKQKPSL